MKISPELSHKLALGAAAILVIGATVLYVNKNGDASAGIDAGDITSGGLGGFGDLLKRLLGTTTGGGQGQILPPLPLPPTGQDGPDLGTDINSTAPTGGTTDYVQNFFNGLNNLVNPQTDTSLTNQGPTQPGAYNTAVNGQGGMLFTPDATPTAGGTAFLPDAYVQTPAGLNTYTVQVNPDNFLYQDGTPMTSTDAHNNTIFTGPTGYVDVSGAQYYQAQYGYEMGSGNAYPLDPATAASSNRLAYVPDTGGNIYQSGTGGLQLVAPGTQLPIGDPSNPYQQFQGYGLTALPSGTPLYLNDPTSPIVPDGSYVLTPLANSQGPDNWVGSQGHNPNNPYDTN